MKEQIQKQASQAIRDNNFNGILLASMRSGKTKMIIDSLSTFKGSILWVVDKTKARDEQVPSELKKWKLNSTVVKNIDLICYQSLKNLGRVYDLIILDEVQTLSEANYNQIVGKYINLLACTGTLPNNRNKLKLYDKLGLKIIYSLSVDDAVINKIVSKYHIEIWNHKLNSSDKNVEITYTTKDKVKKNFFTTELERYNYISNRIDELSAYQDTKFLKINRLRYIGALKTKENIVSDYLVNNQNKRVLIFCSSKEQADRLSLSYHSGTNEDCLNAFMNKQINHLAVVKMLNTSWTIHDLDTILILSSNSSKVESVQRIGRSLMFKKNHIAQIIMLCAYETVEKGWIEAALTDLDKSNINYVYI